MKKEEFRRKIRHYYWLKLRNGVIIYFSSYEYDDDTGIAVYRDEQRSLDSLIAFIPFNQIKDVGIQYYPSS